MGSGRKTDAFKEGRARGAVSSKTRNRGVPGRVPALPTWAPPSSGTSGPTGGPRSLAVLAHGHPSELRTLTVGGACSPPPSQKSGPNREVRCLLEQTFPGENVHQKLTLQARGSFPDKLTRCPSGHVLDRGPGSFLTLMPTRPQTCLRRASAL